MYQLRHQKYKIEHTEMDLIDNAHKKNSKGKKYFFKVRKDLRELNDCKLKDREIEIRTETDDLFTKPIIIPAVNMNKFEKEEIKKKGTNTHKKLL